MSLFLILTKPSALNSPKDEPSVLKAVQNVHAMIDKEVVTGTDPKNVFVCGFSQGGLSLSLSSKRALTLASVLLYPKTLGGGVVFSGWIPFNSSLIEKQYCFVSRSMRPQLLVVIAFRRASRKKKNSSEVFSNESTRASQKLNETTSVEPTSFVCCDFGLHRRMAGPFVVTTEEDKQL
ncbi:hypothetical protein Pint_22762 [Pistacia integerrima]|uniref:Uncharacterized protein n=1 Tax=Pistacia integerrima TaxID=434235 RepID=A0ACC0YM06_9ROSI|nr:hypothetical protein Pint_22762 [Pistacia integerrima]